MIKFKAKSKTFLNLIIFLVFISVSQVTYAENVSYETIVNNKKIKIDFEKDKKAQIEYLKKTIKKIKKEIFILLSEKPEKLSLKENKILNILKKEIKESEPGFLENFNKPIKNFKQYSDFRKKLIKEKKDFLDLDLNKMEITFFKEGKNNGVEKISAKGRPGSWWETPPGLYFVQGKRPMVKLTLSKEDNPIFMPNAVRFSGLFFIHRWPEDKKGEKLPGYYTEGCIRLNDKVSQKVYDYAKNGMPILIYDEKKDDFKYKNIENYVHDENVVSAEKFLIADLDNNKILLSKNKNKKVYLNNVTKLIFMLAATEWKEIKEKKEPVWLNTSEQYFPKTKLKEGVKYSLLDLGSLMLAEKSEAANEEIADRIWGSKIKYMNWKSEAIGMSDFEYTNYVGNKHENKAKMSDIFYLLKNLQINRKFILDMTLNKAYNKKYDKNIFSNKLKIDSIWKKDRMFEGGITGTDINKKEYGAGVFKIKIKNKERNLAFIIFDSNNLKMDTEILKGFLKFYYDN